ncbi:MAG: ATP-dependent Clp protease proteolytic subunit [Hyphomicrobiaceae bacterium]
MNNHAPIWWFAACGMLALFFAWPSLEADAPGLSVREEPDRLVYRWRGPVDAAMVTQFDDTYHRWRHDPRRIVISLHSDGGSVDQGSRVIDLVRRMKRTHDVDTLVEAGRYCASMCVPIYLAGSRRTAAARANFMFHEVRFDKAGKAEIDKLIRSMGPAGRGKDHAEVMRALVARATDKYFEEYLEPKVGNDRWLADMRKAIRGRDVWRTAQQLLQEQTTIVHTIE